MSNDPFSSFAGSSAFTLFVEPILFTNTVSNASLNDAYRNIITLDSMPPGPLSDMVVQMHVPRLSEFNGYGGAYGFSNVGGSCVYAISRYPKSSADNNNASSKNANFFMSAEELPLVLSYLKTHGYSIDTEITKVIHQSGIGFGTEGPRDKMGYGRSVGGKKRMICSVFYKPV